MSALLIGSAAARRRAIRPTLSVGCNVLVIVAELEADLIGLRQGGMRVARGQGSSAWQAAKAPPAPTSAGEQVVRDDAVGCG